MSTPVHTHLYVYAHFYASRTSSKVSRTYYYTFLFFHALLTQRVLTRFLKVPQILQLEFLFIMFNREYNDIMANIYKYFKY